MIQTKSEPICCDRLVVTNSDEQNRKIPQFPCYLDMSKDFRNND